jgi:hypothetical protein
MMMSKKVDYSLKFYKGMMTNTNDEVYKFYLAGRTACEAYDYLENHIRNHSDKYHIIPDENDINKISIKEVRVEDYGKDYGYEIIN